MGAVGRPEGAGAVTHCDRLRRADWRGPMSRWVANSLATLLERSCRDLQSS